MICATSRLTVSYRTPRYSQVRCYSQARRQVKSNALNQANVANVLPRLAAFSFPFHSKASPPIHSKIETVPFHMAPETASVIAQNAAENSFGSLAKVSTRFPRQIYKLGLANECDQIERVGFTALLVPIWRLDLFMKGLGRCNESRVNLSLFAENCSIPAHSISPLDQFSLAAKFDSIPELYDPNIHDHQFDGQQVNFSKIEFSLEPSKLLTKFSVPRKILADRDGFLFDPTSFSAEIFAVYPLMLPVYLAEFQRGNQRVTVVVSASTALPRLYPPSFSVYKFYETSPVWTPNNLSGTIDYGRLRLLPEKTPEEEEIRGGQILDRKWEFWLNAYKRDATQFSLGYVESDKMNEDSWRKLNQTECVQRYSQTARENQAYVSALADADNLTRVTHRGVVDKMKKDGFYDEWKQSSFFDLPESFESWVAENKRYKERAQKVVEIVKPKWLNNLNNQKKLSIQEKKRARGR